MNNLRSPRTSVDNREERARGHELICTSRDTRTGIYGSEGWREIPGRFLLLTRRCLKHRVPDQGGPRRLEKTQYRPARKIGKQRNL